ncbi:MAG: sugar transferase [Pirellula sp.]|nr:sugar transferase [Pirellula sp.]
MERLLTKERIRCDRYEQYFSLIAVHFNQVPEVTRATQEHSLTRFLSTKLRLIDDFGVLRNGGLGILLPMTDLEGGKVVLGKILNHADQHGLSIEADVFAYHGRLNTSSKDNGANDIDDSYYGHLESHDHLGRLGDAHDEPLEDKIQAFRNHWDLKSAADGCPKNEAENLTSRPRLHAPQSDVIVSDIKTNINRSDSAIQCFDRNSAEILKLCTPSYPIWKRQLDIIGASIGLIGSFPILVIAGVAIKLTSTGPVFFKQSRCGHFGKPFLIYKLRTMSENAEQTKHLLEDLNERDGPAFKIQNDPRVTRVGKFLRATGIDELPQLINVLKGEMAIVGPRPLPVSEDQECSTWQQRRLDTKPGITCLWQISKSRKMTFDEWMRLDLHYLKKRSPIYDASLIMRTIKAVFTGRVGH